MRAVSTLLAAACLIAGTALFAGCVQQEEIPQIHWNLTLTDGTEEQVLSLADVRALPPVEGYGFAVSTVGIKYGPYYCRGASLADLAGLVGGIGSDDLVHVSAPDGYLWVFDAEQAAGEGFFTFSPELREIPSPPLRVILAYEQDHKPLSYDDGGPLRLVIVSDSPDVITEGSSWVKWVDRIEIRRR